MKMQQNKKLKSLHLLKRILFVFAFLNFLDFSFAENENSKLANKKTALRCLETASNYIFEKNWEAAKSQACFGIAYDDSISDLWYLYAVSENALGKTKAAVLPLIEKAIKNDSWSNYNRDNARPSAHADGGQPRGAATGRDVQPTHRLRQAQRSLLRHTGGQILRRRLPREHRQLIRFLANKDN